MIKELFNEKNKKAWDWIEDHAYELLSTTDPEEKEELRKEFYKVLNNG